MYSPDNYYISMTLWDSTDNYYKSMTLLDSSVDTLQDCINKGAEVNCQDYNVSNTVYRTHLKIIKIEIVYL
jgi:hypothetical protein